MKILHLSDLHFHSSNSNNQEALATLDYVKANYPEHYIVITGDITDDGLKKQYDNAYAALKDLNGRIFVCPGNHDVAFFGNLYNLEVADRFDKKLSKPLEQGGSFGGENKPVVNIVKDDTDIIMFIALDTSIEDEDSFNAACGEVGDFQLNALSNILLNPATLKMTKVLFFHHHPFEKDDPFMKLKDAEKFIRTIYDRVDVVLFGHKHKKLRPASHWGAQIVTASDNSPGKSEAVELTIDAGKVSADYVSIA